MDNLIIDSDNKINYIRVQLVTWMCNPMTPSVFDAGAEKAVYDLLNRIPENSVQILNFRGITTIEDHALSDLGNRLSRQDNITIICYAAAGEDSIVHQLNSQIKFSDKVSISKNEFTFLLLNNRGVITQSYVTDEMISSIKKAENEYIERVVRRSYRQFSKPERLESTPIYASGVFNARKIVTDPESFKWVCALLAEKFEEIIEKVRPKRNSILAVSLRASPFAAAIKHLSTSHEPYLEIVDHLGPTFEMFDGPIFQADAYENEYVLIVDFIVGGSELKTARAYALSQGADIKAVLAIGAFLNPNAYGNPMEVSSLTRLKKAVPTLRYEFKDGDD